MPETRTVDFRNLAWAFVALAGIVQFLGVLLYAAAHYPDTYQWHQHFISDLGRIETAKGLDNTEISRLFAASSCVLGICLLPFLLVYPTAFQRGRLSLRILAVVTVLGLIGIGQTPYDKHFFLHHLFLVLWVLPMVVLAIALPILVLNEGGSPMLFCILSATLLVAALVYASIGSYSGYVIMQKIVVLISLVWFVVLTSTAVVISRWTPSDRQQAIAAQAAWYEQKLRQRRR